MTTTTDQPVHSASPSWPAAETAVAAVANLIRVLVDAHYPGASPDARRVTAYIWARRIAEELR